ncbi:MAG: FG-GAP-like repeat-containing protein, partial [Silvibacterium sp.]
TSGGAPSTSEAVSLTISGTFPSLTSLSIQNAGQPYSFGVTASGSGLQPLLGKVELLDTTASSVVDSLGIDASQLHSGPSIQTPYQVGQQPVSIVSGDFNHDGIPDLAVANFSSGTVSILLGNASGGFEIEQTFQVGNNPNALAAADFNGDGFLDLAVVSVGDDTVTVFLGNPDQPGTFSTLGSTISVGGAPVALTVNDFNGDGLLDIAVANFLDNSVTVLLGNPNDPGKFTTVQTVSVGQGPVAIVSADFTGDGIQDLAVANFNDNSVWVLAGDPQHPGQFVEPQHISATGLNPTSLAVADFNNDGIPDLAVSNSGDGTVSVLWGVSGLDGVFPTQQIITAGIEPESVAVGDFNNDGIPDIAVSNAGDGTLGVLLNEGNGNFQSQAAYEIGTGPRQVIPWSQRSGESAGLASINIDAGTAIVLAEGSTFSGTFNKESLGGTGIHQIEAMYVPSGQSPYGESSSNAIAINLGSVSKTTQTIVFPAIPSVVYGVAPVRLAASASSGLPISYEIISGPGTVEGSEIAISGAGNIVIEADQSGNATYASASPVQQTLVVNKAPLVVKPANATRDYDQANPEFAGTVSGVVSGDDISATYSSSATASTPPGAYSEPPYGISASIVDPLGRIDNYAATMEIGTLTIAPDSGSTSLVPQTISFPALPSVIYGASP